MRKNFVVLLCALLTSGIASANLYMCNDLNNDTLVVDVLSAKSLQLLDSQGLGGTHLRRMQQRFHGYDTYAGPKMSCPPSQVPNQANCTAVELLMLSISPSMVTGSSDGLLWEGPMPSAGQHYVCKTIN